MATQVLEAKKIEIADDLGIICTVTFPKTRNPTPAQRKIIKKALHTAALELDVAKKLKKKPILQIIIELD